MRKPILLFLAVCVLGFGSSPRAQEVCEPQYSISNRVHPTAATGEASSVGQYQASLTVGQPLVEGATNYTTSSVANGFWSYYLKEPRPPIVRASDGDYQDKVHLQWTVEDERTGAPVTGSTVTIYRNGQTLVTLPVGQTDYQDFNVFPGEYYVYGVTSSNGMGASHTENNIGFLNPNGIITGHIQTPSGNAVKDTKVLLTPNLGRSAFFDGSSYIYYFDANTSANRLFDGLRGDYTIETWFRSINTQQQTIFAAVDSATADRYVLLELTETGRLRWRHSSVAGGSGAEIVTVKSCTEDRAWHHLAAVFDHNDMTLYLDGAIVGHSTATGPVNDKVEIVLGKRSPLEQALYFSGRLDDFRIWREPRLWADIRNHMDLTLSGEEHNLAAYWKFDEVEGDIVFDLTAENNDGAICGVVHDALTAPVYVGALTDSLGNYAIKGIYYQTGTTFTATPQKKTSIGRSLELDGVDDFVSFQGQRVDLTAGYTIEGWFKTSGQSDQTLIAAVRPADGSHRIRVDVTAAGNVKFSHFDSDIVSPARYNDELWHHWAATCDTAAATVALYVDGVASGTRTSNVRIPDLSEMVIARHAPDSSTGYFDGYLDEMRIWGQARDAVQIDGTRNQVLEGDEFGLRYYWRMNDGIGNLVADASGSLVTGTVQGAVWSEDIPLNEMFVHTYEPESRQVTLSRSNTAVDRVEYTDISMIPISGYVRYENTACFQDRVELLINAKSFVPPRYTDNDGKYIVEREPGSQGDLLTLKYKDHTFVPPFIELPLISRPITGLYFNDRVTRKVSGKVVGGDCGFPITPSQGQIVVHLRAINGCIETSVIPDAQSGMFNVTGLPPLIYEVNVDHPDPEIDAFFTADTLSLEQGDGQINFVYRSLPKVTAAFPDAVVNSCDMKVLEMLKTYPVTVKVFEEYVSYLNGNRTVNTCPVTSGTLTIRDAIGDRGQLAPVPFQNGTATYSAKAMLPNIVSGGDHPYQKNLQVTARDDMGRAATAEVWAYVLGNRPRTVNFTTTTPELPLMILREPPGDGSYSYIEQGTSVQQSMSFSMIHDQSASSFFKISLGPDVTTSVGLGAEVEIDVDATLDFGMGFEVGISQTSATEQTWSMTATETVTTAGGGDVYVGGALNVLYGITDVLELSECVPHVRQDIIMVPDGFATKYVYSESHILNTLIPSLIAIGKPESAEMWRNIVARNQELKEMAFFMSDPSNVAGLSNADRHALAEKYFSKSTDVVPGSVTTAPAEPESDEEAPEADNAEFQKFYDSLGTEGVDPSSSDEGAPGADSVGVLQKNISFDAGAQYSYSLTTSMAKTETFDIETVIAQEVALEAGIAVNGVGVSGGFAIRGQMTRGQSQSTTTEQSNTVGFVLADDDLGDNYSVNLATDGIYGPVFALVSGTSSCPWQEGTVARDNPRLSVSPLARESVAPDQPAVFTLNIGNASEVNEDREYYVKVIQGSNPNGAVIAINGVVLEDHMSFFVPADSSLDATMTILRGPAAYTYNDLKLRLVAPCDEVLADTIAVDVSFEVPCSEVTIQTPENGWLVTSNTGSDTLMVTLAGFTPSDPTLDHLELQYRRGQGDWFVARTIARDRLDQLAANHESYVLVPWNISPSIVIDGEYQLRGRAVCTAGLSPGTSQVVAGVIDRNPPRLLGAAEPTDGILQPDDRIAVTFNEAVQCGAISVGAKHITLKNTVTGEAVDFTYTCGNNQIVIEPNIQNRFLENQTLRASVGPVEDVHGNVQTTPIEWEFFVNQNPVEWSGLSIKNIVIYNDQEYSTTRTLVNRGGSNRSYEITNLPSWLQVSPTSGILTPGSSETISFHLRGSETGAGSYKRIVYASGTQGDEPMPVDIRVLCYPPVWGTLKPSNFQYTMTVTANLWTDGVRSDDPYDIVGAFVSGQLRGVASVQYIPEFADLANTHPYEVFLTVYSNVQSGESLSFSVWDASECRELGMVREPYSFVANAVHGTPTSPATITSTSEIMSLQAFPEGWTWFSLNLRSSDMSSAALLRPFRPASGDLVKSQTSFSQYVPNVGWLGTLATLGSKSMYLLKLSRPDTLRVIGYVVDVETDTIPVVKGWNWIGYTPQQSLGVKQALGSLNGAATGDLIKSQFAYAQFVENLGWIGSLRFMNPRLGYLLNARNPGKLLYPFYTPVAKPAAREDAAEETSAPSSVYAGQFGAAVPAGFAVTAAPAGWQVDPRAFQNTLTLTGSVRIDGVTADTTVGLVAAFVGDQCRGVAQSIYIPELDRALNFLMVYSDVAEGETVRFRVFDPANGLIRPVAEEVAFQADAMLGSVEAPFTLTARPLVMGDPGFVPDRCILSAAFPNPFNSATRIGYGLPAAGSVQIVVYSLLGQRVRTLVSGVEPAGYRWVLWDGRDDRGRTVSSGSYLCRMEAGGFRDVRKLVVLK